MVNEINIIIGYKQICAYVEEFIIRLDVYTLVGNKLNSI